jgi:hypothetical protein
MKRLDLSISMNEAAARSLILVVPLAFTQFVSYVAVKKAPMIPEDRNLLLFGVLILAGLLIHELIHVFIWSWIAGKPLNVFKLGFQWKTLTPYAHCTEPMDIFPYRIGTAAPGFVLGILPWLLSLITGDVLVFLFGLLYTSAAGGDFLILWIIRRVKPGALVEDHPTNAGCFVIEEL